MTMNLTKKKCIPCEDKSIKPVTRVEATRFTKEIKGWKLSANAKNITRVWLFSDFVHALKFVNAVGKIAEKEGHHPDFKIEYNKVALDLSTHSIKGLSENDFIIAAKINLLKTG